MIEVKGKSKPKDERATRRSVLALARESGVEEQVIKLLNKYDEAMKNTMDPREKEQIATMGVAELHTLLGVQGPCIVNGREILPGRPGWEKDVEKEKNLIKLD